MYEENYKIASDIAESRVTILGVAAYEKSEILMKDSVILFIIIGLFYHYLVNIKKFVRTSMHTYLKGMSERMKITPNEEKWYKTKFVIVYQDILLLIKNFNLEELQFW